MRIAHVIIDLRAGGAEGMLKRLVEAQLGQTTIEHRVISLRTIGSVGEELQRAGVQVEALDLRSIWDLPAVMQRLAASLRRDRPDVVQTWMYHSDLLGGLVARAVGIRTVVWNVRVAEMTRDMDVPLSTIAIRRVCAVLSAIIPKRIVYVAHSARKIHEGLGYARDRGIVIPNGYAATPDRGASTVRDELGFDGSIILIGTAGRFSSQKGHRAFIAIASTLAQQNPKLRFVMAGRGNDTDNRQLQDWLAVCSTPDRFRLLGERSDMPNVLGGLDIFCLNSLGEGFPNVIAEAMGAGVPCVATDVGDTAYLLGDGGIVVPPRNPSAFEAALAQLVQAGPEGRRAMGERGRARLAEHFSIRLVSKCYEDLYRDLVSEKQPSVVVRRKRDHWGRRASR